MTDGHLDDLLSEFLFSANFDGDTGKDRMAIAKYVQRMVTEEREACAAMLDKMQPEAGDIVSPDWYYGVACAASEIRSRP